MQTSRKRHPTSTSATATCQAEFDVFLPEAKPKTPNPQPLNLRTGDRNSITRQDGPQGSPSEDTCGCRTKRSARGHGQCRWSYPSVRPPPLQEELEEPQRLDRKLLRPGLESRQENPASMYLRQRTRRCGIIIAHHNHHYLKQRTARFVRTGPCEFCSASYTQTCKREGLGGCSKSDASKWPFPYSHVQKCGF